VDYYTARGWMLGKAKMKDWRAAVRTWEKNQRARGNGQGTTTMDDIRARAKEFTKKLFGDEGGNES
jgi:hypothetical protein